jgi:hypothetical protein
MMLGRLMGLEQVPVLAQELVLVSILELVQAHLPAVQMKAKVY